MFFISICSHLSLLINLTRKVQSTQLPHQRNPPLPKSTHFLLKIQTISRTFYLVFKRIKKGQVISPVLNDDIIYNND